MAKILKIKIFGVVVQYWQRRKNREKQLRCVGGIADKDHAERVG